jgi:hypothetical protein
VRCLPYAETFSRGNSQESGKAKTPEGKSGWVDLGVGGRAERSRKGGAERAVPMSSSGCLIHWRSSRCPIAVLHLFSSPNRLQFLLMSVADGSRDSARTYGQPLAKMLANSRKRNSAATPIPAALHGSHACVLQAMRSRLEGGMGGHSSGVDLHMQSQVDSIETEAVRVLVG